MRRASSSAARWESPRTTAPRESPRSSSRSERQRGGGGSAATTSGQHQPPRRGTDRHVGGRKRAVATIDQATRRLRAAEALQGGYRSHLRAARAWHRPWEFDLRLPPTVHTHARLEARRRAAAALCIQATARRRSGARASWRSWLALLALQAYARGWATRKALTRRPSKLGSPLRHPMTRLVHPIRGYFDGQKQQPSASAGRPPSRGSPAAGGARKGRSSVAKAASPQLGGSSRRPASPSANGTSRRHVGGASQAFEREVSAAQLQMELERARHKQVRSILHPTAAPL